MSTKNRRSTHTKKKKRGLQRKQAAQNPLNTASRVKRRWTVPVGLTALVGLITALALTTWTKLPLPTGEGFNVVLISLDTTRADHLGCFGHPTAKTPHIDRLASLGTLFTQCTSSVPITLPSHASIMTGTYPFVHGVRDNGSFRLHRDNTTLAEVLTDAGYNSAAVIAAHVLDREYGLDQGFALYNDMSHAREPIDPRSGKGNIERPGKEVVDVAIEWLEHNAAQKFFLFVHLFDAHAPYEAPEPFASDYEDPYVAEIVYVDAQVGRLLDFITASGLDDNTLLVLTTDHGEGRDEHQEIHHGNFLYDTTTRTPLIFRCADRIPAGRRITAQARSIDIMPSILSFVGLKPPDHCQGVNLMELVAAESDDPELAAYCETMLPLYNYGFSHTLSMRAGGWKYIHAPRPELYDLNADPGELRNLASAEPDRMAAMHESLQTLLENSPIVDGAEDSQVQLSQRAIEVLQSLGYVGNTPSSDDLSVGDRETLLHLLEEDPKDHTEAIRLTQEALGFIAQQDARQTERTLRDLVERFPETQEGFSWAYSHLGRIITARRGDYDEAIAYLEKAIQFRPNDGVSFEALGAAFHRNGQDEESVEAYNKALQFGPVTPRVHFNLAISLYALGRTEEADAHNRLAQQLAAKQQQRP